MRKVVRYISTNNMAKEKEAKSKALESRLINNIGYCPQCGKKHPKGKHSKEEKTENKHGKEEEREEEEEDGEEE